MCNVIETPCGTAKGRFQCILTRQTIYMYKRNIETRSRNIHNRGKVVSITYSEYVSVALVIQHAMRMRHIMCGSTIFFYVSA